LAVAELLCEIIAQGANASAETFRPRTGYDALILSGFLQEAGVVQSISCDECDVAHDAEVIFEGGRYGFFCPKIGFVPVERSELFRVKPDLQYLIRNLADTFNCKRRKTTPVHGQTWRVGAIETIAGALVLFFHPSLQNEQDVQDLEAALRREIKSPFRLILTADGTASIPGAKTARLDAVVELHPVSGAMIAIADASTIVEAPLENSGGRPNRFGVRLEAIILTRLQDGRALAGRNKEASAILDVYREQFPNEQSPSLPTIKRYLTKVRGGS